MKREKLAAAAAAPGRKESLLLSHQNPKWRNVTEMMTGMKMQGKVRVNAVNQKMTWEMKNKKAAKEDQGNPKANLGLEDWVSVKSREDLYVC